MPEFTINDICPINEVLSKRHLSANAMKEYLKGNCSFEEKVWFARSYDLDAELIRMLLKDNSDSLAYIIAMNPGISVSMLRELSDHPDENVRWSVVKNDKTPEYILKKLINDTSTRISEAAETRLIVDNNPFIDELYRHCMGSLHERLETLGLSVSSLHGIHTKQQFVYEVLGSAHPIEVKSAFSGRRDKGFEALNVMLELKQVFFNPVKQRLDRHGYLEFLKIHNHFYTIEWLYGVEAAHIKYFLDNLGLKALLSLGLKCAFSEGRDTIRMFYAVTCRDKYADSLHQMKLVNKWLQTNNDFGKKFHDYLMRKERRDFSVSASPKVFPQVRFVDNVHAWNQQNPGYLISLPSTRKELSALGMEQRNCVGGRHYANFLELDIGYIFTLAEMKTNGQPNIKRTLTFQMMQTGGLLQVKGWANSKADTTLRNIGAQASWKIFGLRFI